jgi:hypothetical protein
MTATFTLYRADALDTSRDAAESIDVTRLENLVLGAIRRAGIYGVTQSELLEQFPDFSYSSITARPSALKRKGLIVDSGVRRQGKSSRSQAVLVAAEFVGGL